MCLGSLGCAALVCLIEIQRTLIYQNKHAMHWSAALDFAAKVNQSFVHSMSAVSVTKFIL